MKIAIVAGGTGGHIYPAVALADELVKRGHDITFFGSNDRMEKDIIPSLGYKYVGLDVYITKGGVAQKTKSLISIQKAYHQCLNLLKDYDMAIGFGNYISLPVVLAAKKLGKKTIIHEQNSFVGRANYMLDKHVDLVIGSYEDNRKQFKNRNLAILGNPQSSKAYKTPKDDKFIESLGLNPNKKTVTIFMGSLGSESVNNKLMDYFKLTDGSYQIIYATGKEYYENVKKILKEKDHIKVFPRIDGIKALKSSTLLISRAGATTIAEITAIGIPSILIPSPFVPNNHQYYNAMALVKKDAALIIEERDLTGELLFSTVDSIINNEPRLKELSENALKLGNKNVVEEMIERIENL